MAALRALAKPMKVFGKDLCQAAIKCYKALWPDEELPNQTQTLTDRLSDCLFRLCEWRESAARVGSDQALTFVMSWYENIELGKFIHLRGDSKWILNPECVEQRKRTAYSFVQYANIHQFREDPYAIPEPAQEEEEEEEESEGDEDEEGGSLSFASDEDEGKGFESAQCLELPSASSTAADE